MSAKLLQSTKAYKEIVAAWGWYEDKQTGLGDRFVSELADKIRAITNNPLHYVLKGNYHEAKMDSFPYLIIFKFNKNEDFVLIVSVFHTSRHPDKK